MSHPKLSLDRLASELADSLQSALAEHRDDLIKGAGGLLHREAVRVTLDAVHGHIPALVVSVLERLEERLATMTVGDLLALITKAGGGLRVAGEGWRVEG